MGKNANQYPVTTPYGTVPGYPLNNGFHQGIDYGAPVGTPVVINGVQIGLSGATGYVDGPHLHVGKWLNGVSYNPKGGFSFKNAVVTEVHPWNDSYNGMYVRVQGDGFSWVYLHLSRITCKVGQKLRIKAPIRLPLRTFYTVRRGDTVSSIVKNHAKKYGLTTDRFKKLNPNIHDIDFIYPNQRVRVK